jgi:uncharacterized delta-60 repeat protein
MQTFKVTVFIYTLFLSSKILSSPSSLDTSFNNNGATTNFFGSYTINQAQALAVQPNGKIITAGYSGDNGVIVQYNNDGTLDQTFNASQTPGYIVLKAGTQTALYAIGLQPDGKIIVAGYTSINNIDNALIARFNRDGSFDGSFHDTNNNNTGGIITTTFGSNSQLYSIALQPNGNIIVAGWSTYLGFANALIARYTSDGNLDTTFNTNGYVTTLIDNVFTKGRAVTLQQDGKIIVAGQAENSLVQQIIVMRYTSDGLLDNSFNSSGTIPGTLYPLDGNDYVGSTAYGIALQPDQKIIVIGSTNQYDLRFDDQSYTIIRINQNGTLDTTFNDQDTPGYILSSSGLQANDALVQSNGQIMTCGFNYSNNYIAIVIRYNTDGSVDPSFNFAINQPGTNTTSNAMSMQADGKIITSGTISTHYTA